MAFGLGIDYLLPREWFTTPIAQVADCCGMSGGWFNISCSIILALLILNAMIMRFRRKDDSDCHDSECVSRSRTYRIEGLRCNHCKANAEKAMAEAETVRIDNAEHATRILIENIVEPLKEELNATRKDLQATKRDMARLRKAIGAANSCRHSDDCPVLFGMRDLPKDRGHETNGFSTDHRGQYHVRNQTEKDGNSTDVIGDTEDSDGQSDEAAF